MYMLIVWLTRPMVKAAAHIGASYDRERRRLSTRESAKLAGRMNVAAGLQASGRPRVMAGIK